MRELRGIFEGYGQRWALNMFLLFSNLNRQRNKAISKGQQRFYRSTIDTFRQGYDAYLEDAWSENPQPTDGTPKGKGQRKCEALIRRMTAHKEEYLCTLESFAFPFTKDILNREGVPTASGKGSWTCNTVKGILTNEKYKGDALLQKSFTVDYLTKKLKQNQGEVPQYYVEGNHEAIIPPETFDLVQMEMEKRRGGCRNGVHFLSGRIRCGDCGGWYGSKVWHSNSKYRRTVWVCNHKYEGNEKCMTPRVTDTEIVAAFSSSVARLLDDRESVLAECDSILCDLINPADAEKERNRLAEETAGLAEKAQAMITKNARTAMDQEEYQRRYEDIVHKYEASKSELDKAEENLRRIRSRRVELEGFAGAFRRMPAGEESFDEQRWIALVDYVIVNRDGSIRFKFKNGHEA